MAGFFVDLVTETIKSEESSGKKTEVSIDILADYLHMKSYFCHLQRLKKIHGILFGINKKLTFSSSFLRILCLYLSSRPQLGFSSFSEPKYYQLGCLDVSYILESELKLSKPNFPSSPIQCGKNVICSPHKPFYL